MTVHLCAYPRILGVRATTAAGRAHRVPKRRWAGTLRAYNNRNIRFGARARRSVLPVSRFRTHGSGSRSQRTSAAHAIDSRAPAASSGGTDELLRGHVSEWRRLVRFPCVRVSPSRERYRYYRACPRQRNSGKSVKHSTAGKTEWWTHRRRRRRRTVSHDGRQRWELGTGRRVVSSDRKSRRNSGAWAVQPVCVVRKLIFILTRFVGWCRRIRVKSSRWKYKLKS